MTNKRALLAHLLIRQKTKPCQFSSVQLRRSVRGLKCISTASGTLIGCLHDPANVQHYICWKFVGRLLDRVNTPLLTRTCWGAAGQFEDSIVRKF